MKLAIQSAWNAQTAVEPLFAHTRGEVNRR